MQYRTLGVTDLSVSILSIGTVELGMEYGIPVPNQSEGHDEEADSAAASVARGDSAEAAEENAVEAEAGDDAIWPLHHRKNELERQLAEVFVQPDLHRDLLHRLQLFYF